jgi:predicted acyltransferase
VAASPGRVLSVDALRGFDMFWIIGGEQVAKALEPIAGSGPIRTLATQLTHVEWEGFRFYDLIFPLFLFLIGVSIVLSMDRTIATAGRTGALVRIARRSALLFAIGIFYYGGISRPWPDVALSGVLPRIALCYLCAASLYVLVPPKGIVIAAAACLIGYWALMTYVPFPDVDLSHPPLGKKATQADARPVAEVLAEAKGTTRGTFAEGHNLAHYVDFRWLPGRKRNLNYSNEGLLSTIPAVAITLFGIMAGWVLTSAQVDSRCKVALLMGAGATGVALGLLWGFQFPLVKRIWTSSFCLLTAGCSAMLLAAFSLVIDVWGWRRWCIPFLWIGGNALTAYLAVNLVDFQGIAARLAGGDMRLFVDRIAGRGMGDLVVAVVALALPLLLAGFLYRRKIFIRL